MSQDFAGRRKLLTIHLPVTMDAFIALQKALADMIPPDTPFSDVCETTGETVTFYAPEDAS